MEILVLNASNRRNGNTAQIPDMMSEEMKKTPYFLPILKTINLGRQNLKICRGCRACFDHREEKCPLKDALLEIRARVHEADGIILSSPVYLIDANGVLKHRIDHRLPILV